MSIWNDIKVSNKQASGQPAPATSKSKEPDQAIPVATSDEAILPEALRARYKVESKVGKGAFGTALLVVDKASNEKYVAKVMNLLQMTPKDKQHVKSEIDCLAQCDHVNIIKYIESWSNDTHLVLVTEYADGGDLGREIVARRRKNLSFNSMEIACVFVQICLALDHVHQKGILHRDVKPANIFFTRRGLVKLGDFGFSKHYEETISNDVGHTLCGTPYYLSPEMWGGERYSKKADLWSVGIVLFEMMTLRRPFTGDSMKQLSDAVRKGVLPSIPDSFDPELVTACQVLLTVDSAQRADFRDVMKMKIFQSSLKTILDLLSHASFVNVREAMTTHVSSFLV
jgi:serine/threonine protein kinase